MGALYATDGTDPRPALLALEGAGLALALGYLAVADPHDRAVVMPRCPIKLATGWDCPSCGGLRVVHDLLRRDVHRAVRDNLFLVAVSPLLVYLLYRHSLSLRTGEPYEVPKGLVRGLLITACAWGIARNLPGWRWKPSLA